MNKRRSRMKTQFFSKYLFLIIGTAILLVILIRWLAFPGWHSQPGGFWTLIGLASVGGIGVIKDLVSIYKDVTQSNKETISEQIQILDDSEDFEQTMDSTGGVQKQFARRVKNGKQIMK